MGRVDLTFQLLESSAQGLFSGPGSLFCVGAAVGASPGLLWVLGLVPLPLWDPGF